MAVAFDAAGGQRVTGQTNTLGFTVASGTDKALFAVTNVRDDGTEDVSTLKWNGESFTEVARSTAGDVVMQLWVLKNPTSKTDSVVAVGSSDPFAQVLAVLSVTGVDQTASDPNSVISSSHTDYGIAITTLDANSWLFGGIGPRNTNYDITPDYTTVFESDTLPSLFSERRAVTTTGSYSLTWSGTGGATHNVGVMEIVESAGLTAVGRTFNIRHDIAEFVGRVFNIRHDLSEFINRTFNIRHDILILVNRTFNLRHDLAQLAGRTFNIRHDLSEFVNRTFNIRHDILILVGRNFNIRHDLTELIGRTFNVRHDLAEFAGRTFNLRHDLAGFVNRTFNIRHDILILVNRTFNIRHDILILVNRTFNIRHDIIQLVNRTFNLRHDLAGVVNRTFNLRHDISQFVNRTFNIRHDIFVLVQVGRTFNLRHDIAELIGRTFNIRHDVLILVNRTFNIRHDVLILVNRTFNVRHDLAELVSRTFNLRHDVAGTVGRTFNIRHDIAQFVARTFNIRHNILNLVSRTFNLRHDILTLIARTFNIRHDLIQLTGRTFNLRHDILTVVPTIPPRRPKPIIRKKFLQVERTEERISIWFVFMLVLPEKTTRQRLETLIPVKMYQRESIDGLIILPELWKSKDHIKSELPVILKQKRKLFARFTTKLGKKQSTGNYINMVMMNHERYTVVMGRRGIDPEDLITLLASD